MRILFSLTYYSPYVSGLTLYVKRLGEAMAKRKYQVSVLSFQHEKKLKQYEMVNGVRIVRAKPLLRLSKGFLSVDWLLKSIQQAQKADVVVINLPQFEGLMPAVFAKLFRKKLIVIYHCEVHLPRGIINQCIEMMLQTSHFLTLMLADKIVTYTKDFADNSLLLPHLSQKLQFVYPPVQRPKINKRVQEMFKNKILGSDLKHAKGQTLIVGIAARLAAEKGIEYVLDAVPFLKRVQPSSGLNPHEIKIVIAGSLNPVGEEQYKKKIFKLVEKYKENIVFLGEVKEEDMGSFYSLLDVLVLPSVNSTEAFGMVQIEAMMMGAPVVATDLPGVRVPVQKTGMGRIVPIKDSQSLSGAIFDVLAQKEKYIKNKTIIKKEFSFRKTISFYEKLFI